MNPDTWHMRDPHVVALRYRIEHSEGIAFEDNTPPIEQDTAAFQMRLANGAATFWMKEHHATADSAKQVVDEYLRPWEIYEAVRPAGTKLKFIFDPPAEVIDRDPSPPGPTAEVTLLPTPTAEVRLLEERYPEPPDDFAANEAVEVMWTLYEGYLQGRDRLPSMAYTCLTRLTYDTRGDEREAARRYHISANILGRLRKLSSYGGDKVSARKWDPRSPPRFLSDQEVKWIEKAIRVIIYRAGQYAANPNGEWPKITMAHLPEL